MARWEIQQRQRRNAVGNLGATMQKPGQKYKRAFSWIGVLLTILRNHCCRRSISGWTEQGCSELVTGHAVGWTETDCASSFRVVPISIRAQGGHWIGGCCGLPAGMPNYAWCFDCTRENSLLLLSDTHRIPAMNLTLLYPRELLGDAVFSQFGAEFPIRFDFLDTMGVETFRYRFIRKPSSSVSTSACNTRRTSYYLLDAGDDGSVCLGLKTQIDRGHDQGVEDVKTMVCRSAPGHTSTASRPASTTISQFRQAPSIARAETA
jgi:hypothetical protein